MLILTIPVLAFFYWISSFDSFSKRLFGIMLGVNIIFVVYAWLTSPSPFSGQKGLLALIVVVSFCVGFFKKPSSQ